IELWPYELLAPRAWALRANLSTYDAAYVALAALAGATLVTLDRRLAGAPGIACPVAVPTCSSPRDRAGRPALTSASRPRPHILADLAADLLQADDPQEGEGLGLPGVGGGRVDDEPLVDVRDVEGVAVELQQAELGVADGLAAGAALGHGALLPQLGEPGALRPQLVDQPAQARVVRVAGRGQPQRRHRLPRRPLLLLGAAVRHPAAAAEEPLPHQVPLPGRPGREVAQQRGGQRVPGQDVALGVDQHRRQVAQPLQQPQRAGSRGRHDVAPPGRRHAGEVEQVVALVVGQPQRPGQRREHELRRHRAPPLLQPHQVVDRDARQLRHLLPAQPGHPAAGAGRQPDVGRRQAGTVRPQGGGEGGTVHAPQDAGHRARRGWDRRSQAARALVAPATGADDGAMTIALITGANRGLGHETARQLAGRGWTILLGARDPDKGRVAAEKPAADGPDVRPVTIDVTDDDSVAAAVEQVASWTDHLDVLVNNAGIIGSTTPPLETGPEDFLACFGVNLLGPVRVTRAFLPLLAKAELPRVV